MKKTLLSIAVILLVTLTGTGSTAPVRPTPQMDVSKGVFLVASREMGDPRFRKTVVLVTEHSREGTVGLIINRPTELPLSEVFPEVPSLARNSDRLYVGGPVHPSRPQLLIRSENKPAGSFPVLDSVYVSSNAELLERWAQDERQDGEILRVYAGYSGWAPGQLDNEIVHGGWHVVPADARTVFDRDAEDVWSELMRRLEPGQRLEA